MFALKTHHPFTDEQIRFAVLEEPALEVGDITNDKELYGAVRAHGKAVIREYVNASYQFADTSRTLTPIQFETEWKGD